MTDLVFGLLVLCVKTIHKLFVNRQELVDSLGFDHSRGHCYTGAISCFAEFLGLSAPRNLFISRQ